ncbi:TetR family transcriptional regulator [Parvibaculum sedimenti]|uniref:TetR family transcriptional regulator n=1 Tax=Parvibaculum sedimenti TaxID=2608632 RepID=A0A6N6VK30_9HYPH|nr:TetR/AcrR family transcriptional regulator [Parvibaculum sedimenti]KAB7738866.1 TetR family transcriptional regulator [Parvibaculum sedimenti]
MARPQAANYDERRKEIVDRAARLFADRGFAGASIADLAKACGTSKALLYHYYQSKDDILYDAMRLHLDKLSEVAEQIEIMKAPAEARLRRLISDFMTLYVDAAAHQKVLLNELKNLPAARRRKIVLQQRKLVAVVERLFVQIQPRFRRQRKLLRPATMLFFGTINFTHTWFRPDGPVSPDQLAAMATDLLFEGIAGLGKPHSAEKSAA